MSSAGMNHLPLRFTATPTRTIKTRESSGKQEVGTDAQGVCLVCTCKQSLYTCSKCFVRYCSAACFQSHNAECTESFSRHRIEGVLRLESLEADADALDLRLIADKLRKSNFNVASLDLEEQDVLARHMTEADRRAMALSMQARGMWWEEEDAKESQVSTRVVATLRSSAPRLSQFAQRPASPAVVYQVVSLVIAHVVLMRTTNGDLGGSVQEATDIFVQSLPQQVATADASFRPRSVLEVVEAWTVGSRQQQAVQSRSRSALRALLLDTCHILRRASFVSLALLQVWVLLCAQQGHCGPELLESLCSAQGAKEFPPAALTALLESYVETFGQPVGGQGVYQAALCRKAFYLLLYSLDPDHDEATGVCGRELAEYVGVFLEVHNL